MSDLDSKLEAYDREMEWTEALEENKVTQEEYDKNHKSISINDFLKSK